MLPLEVAIAKRIANKMDCSGQNMLLPDGKVQVSVEDGVVKNVVVSYQAEKNRHEFVSEIIEEVLNSKDLNIRHFDHDAKLIQFEQGGFDADTGLTGRKNALWYGPSVPIGGGAFAGKDPSKVDRSGAYWARKLAIEYLDELQNVSEVLTEMTFAIGKDKPISIKVNGEKKETVNTYEFIGRLDLKKPIYKKTSYKGHFGTDEFTWDKLDS